MMTTKSRAIRVDARRRGRGNPQAQWLEEETLAAVRLALKSVAAPSLRQAQRALRQVRATLDDAEAALAARETLRARRR